MRSDHRCARDLLPPTLTRHPDLSWQAAGSPQPRLRAGGLPNRAAMHKDEATATVGA
jgi:hypothetical protein